MALVVFLRAVNLGKRTLRTKELAERLGLANVGAAGTFVAPGRSDAAALAREVRKALPFETEVMVLPGKEVLALLERRPAEAQVRQGLQRFVSVLARAGPAPGFPVERPPGRGWLVRLVEARGRLVVSLRRPDRAGDGYPNPLVEEAFGSPATTRGWPTLEAVGKLLGTSRDGFGDRHGLAVRPNARGRRPPRSGRGG
jgi:uncharacterized protein (DUF1697 family)